MDKKKISDAWKSFLDMLIDEADISIQDYYDSDLNILFETALGVIQKTLKENGIFE